MNPISFSQLRRSVGRTFVRSFSLSVGGRLDEGEGEAGLSVWWLPLGCFGSHGKCCCCFSSLHFISLSPSRSLALSLSGLSSPCCLLFAVSVVRIVCSTINNNNELAMF